MKSRFFIVRSVDSTEDYPRLVRARCPKEAVTRVARWMLVPGASCTRLSAEEASLDGVICANETDPTYEVFAPRKVSSIRRVTR